MLREKDMHIRNYLAALEFVNQERARRDLRPIERLERGLPRDPKRCAIARSIPGVTVTAFLHERKRRTRPLPKQVLAFVAAFDAGGSARGQAEHGDLDPANLVEDGIEDDKGCLVPA